MSESERRRDGGRDDPSRVSTCRSLYDSDRSTCRSDDRLAGLWMTRIDRLPVGRSTCRSLDDFRSDDLRPRKSTLSSDKDSDERPNRGRNLAAAEVTHTRHVLSPKQIVNRFASLGSLIARLRSIVNSRSLIARPTPAALRCRRQGACQCPAVALMSINTSTPYETSVH